MKTSHLLGTLFFLTTVLLHTSAQNSIERSISSPADTHWAVKQLEEVHGAMFMLINEHSIPSQIEKTALMYLTPDGSPMWTLRLGSTLDFIRPACMTTYANGDALVASTFFMSPLGGHDILLTRIDTGAIIVKSQIIRTNEHDEPAQIILLPNNDVLILGHNQVKHEWHSFILHLNADWDIVNMVSFTREEFTYLKHMQVQDDGRVLLSGFMGESGQPMHALLALLDEHLNLLWVTKTYLPGTSTLGFHALPLSHDGHFRQLISANFGTWVVHYNQSGLMTDWFWVSYGMPIGTDYTEEYAWVSLTGHDLVQVAANSQILSRQRRQSSNGGAISSNPVIRTADYSVHTVGNLISSTPGNLMYAKGGANYDLGCMGTEPKSKDPGIEFISEPTVLASDNPGFTFHHVTVPKTMIQPVSHAIVCQD